MTIKIIAILLVTVFSTSCRVHGDSSTLSPGGSINPLYTISELEAYEIAYAQLAQKLGYAPPKRPEWKWWSSTLNYDYAGVKAKRLVWNIGADFAPSGGGDHGNVIIDANTGEVLYVNTGRHLR